MMATQSINTANLLSSGDQDTVFAPTMDPSYTTCIEATTDYQAGQAQLWAFNWCTSNPGVGKWVNIDSTFMSNYVANGAYTVKDQQTDAANNTWTMYLLNVQTNKWDTFWSSTGPAPGPFSKLPYPAIVASGPTTVQWIAGDLVQRPVSIYAYEVQGCNGSYCTNLSNALAVTPMTTSAAAGKVTAAKAGTPLTPQQLALQAFFGGPVTPARAAAMAAMHPPATWLRAQHK